MRSGPGGLEIKNYREEFIMSDALQPLPVQATASTFELPLGRQASEQTLFEFLEWIEQTKGLTLCQAFKPQYDWYMPAFANKEKLAHEFLGKQPSPDHN
jgi:hypothetical protein